MQIFETEEISGGLKLSMQVVFLEKSVFAWVMAADQQPPNLDAVTGKLGGLSVAMPAMKVNKSMHPSNTVLTL